MFYFFIKKNFLGIKYCLNQEHIPCSVPPPPPPPPTHPCSLCSPDDTGNRAVLHAAPRLFLKAAASLGTRHSLPAGGGIKTADNVQGERAVIPGVGPFRGPGAAVSDSTRVGVRGLGQGGQSAGSTRSPFSTCCRRGRFLLLIFFFSVRVWLLLVLLCYCFLFFLFF